MDNTKDQPSPPGQGQSSQHLPPPPGQGQSSQYPLQPGSKVTTPQIMQECIPVGCVPPAQVDVKKGGSVSSGRWGGGGVLYRAASVQGTKGSLSRWGLCLRGGLCQRDPLSVDRMTHACENITFPRLRLRAVIISYQIQSMNTDVTYRQ